MSRATDGMLVIGFFVLTFVFGDLGRAVELKAHRIAQRNAPVESASACEEFLGLVLIRENEITVKEGVAEMKLEISITYKRRLLRCYDIGCERSSGKSGDAKNDENPEQ